MVEIREIPLAQIHRPLPRVNDSNKVKALMESIAKEGLREPIDVLEVEGKYYGFSGCHRYEAHQRLGKETIKCRVRQATPSVLQRHLA
ncbi:MAG: ParB N-terminal domain-containing protein [Symploca sp. SIO2G7]|nr:ParB N-terminal domain-containing protein [Symploca sp. SIO2G7]